MDILVTYYVNGKFRNYLRFNYTQEAIDAYHEKFRLSFKYKNFIHGELLENNNEEGMHIEIPYDNKFSIWKALNND